MAVTIQFADRVLKLHRQQRTVAEIALELRVAEVDVQEAYRMLALPSIDDEKEEAAMRAAIPGRTAEQREAARDTMPKKMAERQRKAEFDREA